METPKANFVDLPLEIHEIVILFMDPTTQLLFKVAYPNLETFVPHRTKRQEKKDTKTTQQMLIDAAARGQLEYITHVHNLDPNVKRIAWAEISCIAAFHGYIDILERLKAIEPGSILGRKARKHIMRAALRGGHVASIEWVLENTYAQLPQDCVAIPAFTGHLHLVKWLVQKGYECGCNASLKAARGGQLEILQWMLENNHDISKEIYSAAAGFGLPKMEILDWAYQHNIPVTSDTPTWLWYYALREDGMQLIKWLEEKKIPMDDHHRGDPSYTFNAACFYGGGIPKLTWLLAHGFAWDKQICQRLGTKEEKTATDYAILDWIHLDNTNLCDCKKTNKLWLYHANEIRAKRGFRIPTS